MKYDKLIAKFKAPEIKDAEGMYANAALDRLFEKQEWVCPIQVDKISSNAYYSPSQDKIVVPKKEQFNIGETPEERFKDGMEYYSSALHEMAHSTGTEERLNRVKGDKFGDPKYAKEELVAELTAANVGYAMGFDKRILDNNAAYLDGWISVLKENPKFIVSVMADVNKASNMVLEAVETQEIDGKGLCVKKWGSVRSGTVANATATTTNYPAVKTIGAGDSSRVKPGMKTIDRETGIRYMLMPEGKAKSQLLNETLTRNYGKDVLNLGRSESRNLKIS